MSDATSGRWVIVLDTKEPPVFWSLDRAVIETVCQVPRKRCPEARVIWRDETLEQTAAARRHDEGLQHDPRTPK